MPIEKRTRVEVFHPLRSDIPAYQAAIDWLADEFAFERGGSTLTAPFAGFFTSSTHTDVVGDAIRILFCDFEPDSDRDSQPSRKRQGILNENFGRRGDLGYLLPYHPHCFLARKTASYRRKFYDTDNRITKTVN